jgi:anaphase-promoting complex subunit 6
MLYIGMEYIQMHNLRLAQEYLESAFQMCDSDPLLLNELGVLHYQKEMWAVPYFDWRLLMK